MSRVAGETRDRAKSVLNRITSEERRALEDAKKQQRERERAAREAALAKEKAEKIETAQRELANNAHWGAFS